MKSEEVIARLNAKLRHDLKCPMCGGTDFSLISGFFINPVQKKPNIVEFDTQSIPTVSLACTNCGFLSQHAMTLLCPDLLKDLSDESGD